MPLCKTLIAVRNSKISNQRQPRLVRSEDESVEAVVAESRKARMIASKWVRWQSMRKWEWNTRFQRLSKEVARLKARSMPLPRSSPPNRKSSGRTIGRTSIRKSKIKIRQHICTSQRHSISRIVARIGRLGHPKMATNSTTSSQ